MTYSLKTALYFIFGILTLGAAIILSVTAPDFPLTSIMMFVGFGLLIAGWFRVFHQHPPTKHLSTILGSILLTACFIFPLVGVGLLGLPTGYLYISTLVSALVGPPFMAFGFLKDVASFYEAREREEDEVINTPLTFNTAQERRDYYRSEITGVEEAPVKVLSPQEVEDFDKLVTTPKPNKEDLDYTPQNHFIPLFNSSTHHVVHYSVPQNLYASNLEIGQHISFVNDEADGTQTFPQGTVTYVGRETNPQSPIFDKIVFKLDSDDEIDLYVADSGDEVFRLMGHLEDGPDPLAPEPRPAIEPIEKMLADAAPTLDTTLTKSTTIPVDPFTEVLEEALTGPLPETSLVGEYTGYKVSAIHVDVEDPKWDGSLKIQTPVDHRLTGDQTFVKFSHLGPGQNITFQEEHRHVFKDNREVTGTVISAKPHDDPSDLAANFMLVTIGGPHAGSYTVHRDHHAVLNNA